MLNLIIAPAQQKEKNNCRSDKNAHFRHPDLPCAALDSVSFAPSQRRNAAVGGAIWGQKIRGIAPPYPVSSNYSDGFLLDIVLVYMVTQSVFRLDCALVDISDHLSKS